MQLESNQQVKSGMVAFLNRAAKQADRCGSGHHSTQQVRPACWLSTWWIASLGPRQPQRVKHTGATIRTQPLVAPSGIDRNKSLDDLFRACYHGDVRPHGGDAATWRS